jgi:hypothetical protein
MEVIGEERPCIDNEIPIQAKIRQTVQKIFPVSVCSEDVCSLDAPAHHMVQGSGSIKSWLSRHSKTLLAFFLIVKLFQNLRPLCLFRDWLQQLGIFSGCIFYDF